MLMMSRREGETILIGDEIEIVIAHIARSRVKVGIRAPRQTLVIAREVKLVRDENLAAAKVGSEPGLSTLLKKIQLRSSSFSGPVRKDQ
jgi:carbon storage regulator